MASIRLGWRFLDIGGHGVLQVFYVLLWRSRATGKVTISALLGVVIERRRPAGRPDPSAESDCTIFRARGAPARAWRSGWRWLGVMLYEIRPRFLAANPSRG